MKNVQQKCRNIIKKKRINNTVLIISKTNFVKMVEYYKRLPNNFEATEKIRTCVQVNQLTSNLRKARLIFYYLKMNTQVLKLHTYIQSVR